MQNKKRCRALYSNHLIITQYIWTICPLTNYKQKKMIIKIRHEKKLKKMLKIIKKKLQ